MASSRFIGAGFITGVDVLVAYLCAPLVWQAWGSFIWSRIGLLSLAGGMAFTLMDIWSQTSTEEALSPLSVRDNRSMFPPLLL